MWDASMGMTLAFLAMTIFFLTSEVTSAPQTKYNTGLSRKLLLASAIAYDQIHPDKCMKNLLSTSKFSKVIPAPGACGFLGGCAGYLAVSKEERAILVAFRGTATVPQLIEESLQVLFVPQIPFLEGHTQPYWGNAFQNIWANMKDQFVSFRNKYPKYEIWITGHSLGGAIASLASTWIVAQGLAPANQVHLYTYGMPRVGDYLYASQHDRIVQNSFRVVNLNDPVPLLPTPAKFSVNTPYHHGIEVFYYQGAASQKSPHKVCLGLPHNEDFTCSVSHIFHLSGSSHTNYFSKEVGTYCESKVKRDLGVGSDPSLREESPEFSEDEGAVNADGSHAELEFDAI